jgi:putative ABC transport system permease protein
MKELFALASRQLGRKKLRVFLIVLGIAIGVAAVIGVTSLGEGIRVQAVEQIKASHDLTTIDVSAGVEEGSVTLITDSKTKVIKAEEHVLFVAPYVKDPYVTQNNTYLAVKGITPGNTGVFRVICNWKWETGLRKGETITRLCWATMLQRDWR